MGPFALTGAEELRSGGLGLAVRYKLESSIAGRPFEPLQVDVSRATPEPWDAQQALRPGLLADLGLDPIEIWLVPLERQVAEKLHAYTRKYESGGTTRAKDLVDLMLIRELEHLDTSALREAIRRVFESRGTHAIPDRLPPPARELAVPYRREAAQLKVAAGLKEAHARLAEWLDPVLAGVRGSRQPPRGEDPH